MLNWFFRWFSRTKLWVWFARKILSNLNLRLWGYTKFPMQAFFEIVDTICTSEAEAPGIYAFACSDPGSFGGWFIKFFTGSNTSHAGVFVPGTLDSDRTIRIQHMKGIGFCDWTPLELMKEIDLLAVVKYEFPDQETRHIAARRLQDIEQAGIPYDFQQEVESENKIYCSELVYQIMKGLNYVGPDGIVTTVKTQRKFERQAFEPDDVVRCASKILWKNY